MSLLPYLTRLLLIQDGYITARNPSEDPGPQAASLIILLIKLGLKGSISRQ